MNISKNFNWIRGIKSKKIALLAYKSSKFLINITFPYTVKVNMGINEKSNTIISLTSFPRRIGTVWMTIVTLLNQTIKPKMVILWLAKEQFPNEDDNLPSKLLSLKSKGLSIQYCEDLRPHKKYYFTMQQYPKCAVITVDDDIYYPETLVEELTKCSEKYPGAVCCTWSHEIVHTDDGSIAPYSEWNGGNDNNIPSMHLLPVGCGGVLYPPQVLDEEVFNKESIKKLCLDTDDLWLKCMAVKKHTPAVRIEKKALIYYSILKTQSAGLHNNNNGKNQNDIAMKAIIKRYPEVQQILLSELNGKLTSDYPVQTKLNN